MVGEEEGRATEWRNEYILMDGCRQTERAKRSENPPQDEREIEHEGDQRRIPLAVHLTVKLLTNNTH